MNSRYVLTPRQMKLLEDGSDKAGVSYEMLMENAGNILAEHISNVFCKGHSGVIFLCGSGNNAGDCFVAARSLRERYGIRSMVLMLCGEPKTALAKLNFDRMTDIPVINEDEMPEILKNGSYVIADGVFGTGFHGELPENVKNIFALCGKINIAADVPSGGNCKTGAAADGTPAADMTVAFGGIKFGMTQYPLRKLCGDIKIADIKIPDSVYGLVDYPIEILGEAKLPERKPDSHKGDLGRLLTVCGSRNMPGAALLSALAAARSGVGLLEVCAPEEYVPHYAAVLPEAVYLPLSTENGGYNTRSYEKIMDSANKAKAVLIGCGLGTDAGTAELVKKLLANINCPVILDADGINCITDCIDIIRQTKQEIILTPHPAEMARLCGISTADVQADRLECAKAFAEKYNCTVVLKGAGTVVAYPDRAYVCLAGNSGMSKGGSGDVLSGIVSSLRAQGIPAGSGVYVHACAGDAAAEKHSMQSMLPEDMICELGGIYKKMELKNTGM